MLITQKSILLRNRLLWTGIAAAAAIACLVILYPARHSRTGDPFPPPVGLLNPRDGATMVLLHRFTWHRTNQPAVYHFFLYEVNRTTVWSTLTKDTSLVLPPDIPLQRGRTYLWRVEAILPGEVTVTSDLRTFTLSE